MRTTTIGLNRLTVYKDELLQCAINAESITSIEVDVHDAINLKPLKTFVPTIVFPYSNILLRIEFEIVTQQALEDLSNGKVFLKKNTHYALTVKINSQDYTYIPIFVLP